MENSTVEYSVIIPVYNEQEVLETTWKRLTETMRGVGGTYELLFVDDGSRDGSAAILRRICEQDPCSKMLSFSRNFGQQAAMSAGIDFSRGKAVVFIDADLQDPPEVIPRMIEKWNEGYEIVYGKRLKRKGETVFKKVTAALFYRLLRAVSEREVPVDVGDFRLIDGKIRDLLKSLPEKNRYIRGLVNWVGFRQTTVEYVREERFAGETKYSPVKLFMLAVTALTNYSKPLRLATWIGFGLSAVSFLQILVVIYEKLFTDRAVQGWASLMAVSLFFNGVILMMLGLVGEYLAHLLDEVKERPVYVVAEKRNVE
ncbi:MAG: glycosyltransferase family 2 protein [Synergistaceae bacterium]|nr:glycosyltransferase family 2 protein [Synergistaceae bacterium]